jgi:hypothetical protein
MGYFANGTAGEDFQCRFCFQCANWRLDEQNPDRGEGCPVWDAHLIAGSQHPEHAKNERDRGAAETTRMLLGVLIEITKDGVDNRCLMYLDNDAPDPRQTTLF